MGYLHEDKNRFREAVDLTAYQTGAASMNHSLPSLIPVMRKARSAAAICPSAQNGVSISWLLQKIVDEQVYKADYETLTVQLLEENISYNTAAASLIDIINVHIFE